MPLRINVSFEKLTLNIDNFLSHGWHHNIGSFHICNEDVGAPQLKIDILKYDDFSASDLLESYRDVCACINEPQNLQNMAEWPNNICSNVSQNFQNMTEWSINNYGNDFLAYYQPDCSENKWMVEHVPAVLWCFGSRCMHRYEKTDNVTNTVYNIRSMDPNQNSKYFKKALNLFLRETC